MSVNGESPKISIVIPAFNAAKLIRPTLEAVVNSTEQDFEVIVIDDGSSDDTSTVASDIDQRIRVVRQPNAGMSQSRNNGIALSKGEFIALLDADDIWHPQKLALQIEALENNPEYHFCFTEFKAWYGDEQAEFFARSLTGEVESSLTGWIYHKMILTNWALPSSMLFRRSAWDQLGPFLCNDHKTDDWEYFVRACVSFQFIKLKEPMVLYRQVVNSLSRQIQTGNSTEKLRDSLIERFGLCSANGKVTDSQELTRRRYLGHLYFADAHCARGAYLIGLKSFIRLLISGPNRVNSLSHFCKSTLRRLFPKS